MAALVLSLACAIGAFACGPSQDTPQVTSTSDDREAGAEALVLPEEAQSCGEIEQWVEANRANLPTDYDALASLPMPYRLAVFGSLPPATRSALFQTQFERYAVEHPNMSAEQLVALQKGRELVTPEWYAMPPDSPDWQTRRGAPLAALQRQVTAAFGHDEATRLFATIGPDTSPELPAMSATPHEQLSVPFCQCATNSDMCVYGKKCISGRIPCIRTSWFCGLTLTSPCNGICIG